MATTRHKIMSLIISAALACSSIPTAALAEALDEVSIDESTEPLVEDSESEVSQEGGILLEETASTQEEDPGDDLLDEEYLSSLDEEVTDATDSEGQESEDAVICPASPDVMSVQSETEMVPGGSADTEQTMALPEAAEESSRVGATSSVVLAKGKVVSNWNAQDYWMYGKVVSSYLVETSSGFMRVQARKTNVLVEYFDSAGNLKKTKTIKNALSLFGGYFHSRDGSNYLVFGQQNSAQSDTRVILRVTRYNSDWGDGTSCDICDINTTIPFDAGSLRMDEAAGKLYIHTCHEMYGDANGYHHQANMTFVLQESNMRLMDSYTSVMNLSEGYVSHSFNQFIRTDGRYLYRIDHGDAYPCGIAFTRTPLSDTLANPDLYSTLKTFDSSGNNYTGASLGGFELSDSHAIVIWNKDASGDYGRVRNVFVTSVGKNGGSAQTRQLTKYQSGTTCLTPQLVKLDERNFLAMWTEHNTNNDSYTMSFARIDRAGKQTGPIVHKRLPQSDCQPILLSDGGVGWFVSTEKAVKLYRIDPFDLEASPEDPFNTASMNRREMRDAVVSNVGMFTWTGTPFKPKPVVTMDGETLVEGSDYRLRYSKNVNAGWATITIKGVGGFKGSISTYFYIDACYIGKATLSLSKTSYTYNGRLRKPTVKMRYGSKRMGKASYDVSYAGSCKNAGTYKVTVTGKGNFWGSKELTFKITKASNPISVKRRKMTTSVAKAKKKAQVVAPITVTKAQGKLAFKVTKWATKKAKKYLKVNKSTGKVTVKKGTPKGTYNLEVKVTAKGNTNYKAEAASVNVSTPGTQTIGVPGVI